MRIEMRDLIPQGMHALVRNGDIVWMGPLGAPIEDAECDLILVSPDDYERIKAVVPIQST
jgi:hypothetical protein